MTPHWPHSANAVRYAAQCSLLVWLACYFTHRGLYVFVALRVAAALVNFVVAAVFVDKWRELLAFEPVLAEQEEGARASGETGERS